MNSKQAYDIFYSAIKSVQPDLLLPNHVYKEEDILYIAGKEINISSINRLLVIAAGKASASMAKEIEELLGDLISDAVCITKYDHTVPLKQFRVLESAHPVPDQNSILAGEIVLEAVHKLSSDDIVLVLLSGGASSLLADIPKGCSLIEIQEVFSLLVNSGASIQEMNIVRKHLSRIKGGQLAKAAYPAKVFTLIISDVVGDDLGSIASGPTVPDNSTFEDAYNVFSKYNIWIQVSESVRAYIAKGLKNEISETPKPGSLFFKNTFSKIIGSNKLALEAAKLKASHSGYHVVILKDDLTGDTEQEARQFVQYLLNYPGILPACILMGGETTLKVTGSGKGGRNQHFALCTLDELFNKNQNKRNITILSGGTDGIDGPTDAAGAVIDSKMYKPGLINEEMLKEYLLHFDAYHFFAKTGGLLKTGPTRTNVMDIVIGLIRD